MHEEIGKTAGAIWHILNQRGELALSTLKKEVEGVSPLFDWAIGWLAREGNIVIAKDKRSIRLRLSHQSSKLAAAV